jgi:hypothetical protein
MRFHPSPISNGLEYCRLAAKLHGTCELLICALNNTDLMICSLKSLTFSGCQLL